MKNKIRIAIAFLMHFMVAVEFPILGYYLIHSNNPLGIIFAALGLVWWFCLLIFVAVTVGPVIALVFFFVMSLFFPSVTWVDLDPDDLDHNGR